MNAVASVYDVFISHSTIDSAVADSIKRYLSAAGVRCWKAPDDILPGESWPSAITRALAECRAIVLVWSEHSVASPEVSKELTLATRNGLTIIPFRIGNAAPTPEWKYHLANTHWMDAFPGPVEKFFPDLLARIASIVGASPTGTSLHPDERKSRGRPPARLMMPVLVFSFLIGLVLAIFGVWKGLEISRENQRLAREKRGEGHGAELISLPVVETRVSDIVATDNSSETGLSFPPSLLSEHISLQGSYAVPLVPDPPVSAGVAAPAAGPLPLAEVGKEHLESAAKSSPGETRETIDGYFRGEFANLNSGRVRDFTIRIKTDKPIAFDPPSSEVVASVAFGSEVDDGLRGTVIYSTRTSFSVGWDNETGRMTFVGQLENGTLSGTWELEPAGGEPVNGTFQASRVVE